jgi:hypothetical protein
MVRNTCKHNDHPPLANHQDLYRTIDSIPLGDVPWQNFAVKLCGDKADVDVPTWMNHSYDVWYRDPPDVVRNMLANPCMQMKWIIGFIVSTT